MLDGLLGVSRTLINGLESTGGPLYPFRKSESKARRQALWVFDFPSNAAS